MLKSTKKCKLLNCYQVLLAIKMMNFDLIRLRQFKQQTFVWCKLKNKLYLTKVLGNSSTVVCF